MLVTFSKAKVGTRWKGVRKKGECLIQLKMREEGQDLLPPLISSVKCRSIHRPDLDFRSKEDLCADLTQRNKPRALREVLISSPANADMSDVS